MNALGICMYSKSLSTLVNEGVTVIWVGTDGTLQPGYLLPLADVKLHTGQGGSIHPSLLF
jgi:hypothetical protein